VEDDLLHEDAAAFEFFIEAELEGLSKRAENAGLCFDCLRDRLVVELVAGLLRSGTPVADILDMVSEALDEVDDETHGRNRHSHRVN
jgi:hypothetical protein